MTDPVIGRSLAETERLNRPSKTAADFAASTVTKQRDAARAAGPDPAQILRASLVAAALIVACLGGAAGAGALWLG